MVTIVPVLSWMAALIAAGIAVVRGPRPIAWRFAADRLLRYLMLFPVGLMGLWAALGHLAFPAEAAQAIGWAESPFQSEVGAANLGIGLAGLYAAFRSYEARFATALAVQDFSAAQASCISATSSAPEISLPRMPGRSYSPIFSRRSPCSCFSRRTRTASGQRPIVMI